MAISDIDKNVTNQKKIAELSRQMKELLWVVSALQSQVQILSDKIVILQAK